jgi:transposase
MVPLVQAIIEEYPELSFQQDNAKGHSSKFTKSILESIGIIPLFWPANSPDLNPIKTIWD